MKITGVAALEFRRTLDGRSYNPATRWNERRAPLIALYTDESSVGLGEAWSKPAEIALVLDCLAHACHGFVGRDIDDPALLAGVLDRGPRDVPNWVAPATASAVEMALWDLRAKHAGQPLWRMLGTGGLTNHGAVSVYASGGLYRDGSDVSDLALEMERYLADGFTAVKMKIGALPPKDDLARVAAVRAAIGANATLWLDAVNQLSPVEAITVCRALASAGAEAIQAPVPNEEIDTMAIIQRDVLPVIAAESEHMHAHFAALLKSRAVGCLQFCLGLCGGYAGAARLTGMAAAHGVPSTPQCNSTAIMQAASLQFGAAQRNVATVEFHRFHDHLAALLPVCMRTVSAGKVTLDATPGIGIATVEVGPQPCGGEIAVHAQFGAQS